MWKKPFLSFSENQKNYLLFSAQTSVLNCCTSSNQPWYTRQRNKIPWGWTSSGPWCLCKLTGGTCRGWSFAPLPEECHDVGWSSQQPIMLHLMVIAQYWWLFNTLWYWRFIIPYYSHPSDASERCLKSFGRPLVRRRRQRGPIGFDTQ